MEPIVLRGLKITKCIIQVNLKWDTVIQFDFKVLHKIYIMLKFCKGIQMANAKIEYGPWYGIIIPMPKAVRVV